MINPSVTGIRKVNVINRRMFILSAAKVLVFSGIIARLFSLQISENKKYLTLSDKNPLLVILSAKAFVLKRIILINNIVF